MNAFTDRALITGRYPVSPGFKEPTTSKEAAASIARGAQRIRIDALKIIAHSPMTADEIADTMQIDRLTIRPRISELRDMGYVTPSLKSDGQQERRPNASGKSAIVWRITDIGTTALREGTVK